MILALIIFAITYVLMLALQKYRPWIALGSAAIFIVLGIFKVYDFSVGLSNILDREGGENLSGSSPMKRTHGTGVAPTLVGS